MSYDYFLFAKPPGGEAANVDSLASGRKPIATPAQLKARIDALFPGTTWQAPHGEIDVWFGINGAEFLFSADAEGYVSVLKVAYIEADQVRRLMAALDLVAFDPQRGGFIGA